jgi:transposase
MLNGVSLLMRDIGGGYGSTAGLPSALPTFAEGELSTPVPVLPASGGHIGIELPSGVKLTVDAGVDAEALARVIAVLTR